jgi:beta-lactamase regulating signal transducer with metallopeptidase domain
LFLARVFPLAVSSLLTLFLVIPSFDILEPRSINEHVGKTPLVLGIGALLLIGCGIWRVVAAQRRTSHLVAGWLKGAVPLRSGEIAATFQSRSDVPPLILVGVCRPKVLVSESTVALLSEDELRIALRHELAHMRAHDNLKKLIFRLSPCPGMRTLESAWSQAAELTADEAAVSSARDAVDLAAALVKLSRLVPVAVTPACTVGFVSGTVETRVARLLAWEEHRISVRHDFHWYAAVSIATALLGLMLTYGPALTLTHEITEWLVR